MSHVNPCEVLAKHFGLYYDRHMQDWAIMVAYDADVFAVIRDYDQFSDALVKSVAGDLIIAAYDSYIDRNGRDLALEERIREIMHRDWDIHKREVRYWTGFDHENDPEGYYFAVTHFMRSIWCQETGEVFSIVLWKPDPLT